MIYLTGSTNDAIEAALIEHGFGIMVQPGTYSQRVTRYRCWGADNGCYKSRWQEEKWLVWLDRLPRERCLFAVAPDVYPDARATLERSAQYLGLLRDMGFPAALVAQDGAESLDMPWDDFDCLFIGGEKRHPPDTEWKIGSAATELVRRARARGKWVHMGRVNSLRRMERARAMGCHSADGTFIAKGPNLNLARARRWLVWLEANPTLPAFATFESPSLPVHREAAR